MESFGLKKKDTMWKVSSQRTLKNGKCVGNHKRPFSLFSNTFKGNYCFRENTILCVLANMKVKHDNSTKHRKENWNILL